LVFAVGLVEDGFVSTVSTLPSGSSVYELEGARLVNYENNYAAYIAYRMQKRPINLLVTSEQTVEPSVQQRQDAA
jgi:hypothetical protein